MPRIVLGSDRKILPPIFCRDETPAAVTPAAAILQSREKEFFHFLTG
jgi:hypothetical protein